MKLTIERKNVHLLSEIYTFKVPVVGDVKKITGIKIGNPNSLIENIVIKSGKSDICKLNNLKNLDIPFNIRDPVYIEFIYNKDYIFEKSMYETIPEIIEEYGDIIEIYDETDGRYYNGRIVTRKDTGNTLRIATKGAEIVVPKFKIYFE